MTILQWLLIKEFVFILEICEDCDLTENWWWPTAAGSGEF